MSTKTGIETTAIAADPPGAGALRGVGAGGRLRRALLGIAPDATTPTRRGFAPASHDVETRLESVGSTFVAGYHAGLEACEFDVLAARLDEIPAERRGWGYEGAAMALAMLDILMPWTTRRVPRLLAGPGRPHVYMVHVGVGWALARLRRRVDRALSGMDPVLGWLAVDGVGFHEGYFHWRRRTGGSATPGHLKGYACRVFDQGLGRSLWFVDGADADRIAQTIGSFDAGRHADLWSGIGLACAYAGGVDRAGLAAIARLAGPWRLHAAQGVAFAAKAREHAGNPASHTEAAAEVLCGRSAADAARLTDEARQAVPDQTPGTYEQWRVAIRTRMNKEGTT